MGTTKSKQDTRLEKEIITAVSRGADSTQYVMDEIRRGEKRFARRVFYRTLEEGKILMTVERRLILPPS